MMLRFLAFLTLILDLCLVNAEPKPQAGISGHLMTLLQSVHSNSKQHIKIEIDTENTKDTTTQITYLDFHNLPANVLQVLGSHKNDFVRFGTTFTKKIDAKNGPVAAKNFVSNNDYLKELMEKDLKFKVGMHPYMDLDEEETFAIFIPLKDRPPRSPRNASRSLSKRSVFKRDTMPSVSKPKANPIKRSPEGQKAKILKRKRRDDLPSSFDWRDHDVVPEVRNQGQCGSCWAFSATACLEIQYARKNNEIIDLAEQQMSCVYDWKTICGGGFPSAAFKHYMNNNGLGLEEDWPYDPKGDLACYSFTPTVSVASTTNLLPFDMDKVKRAIVEDGPVAVGIYVNWDFMYYESGNFDSSCEGEDGLGGHAMVITGYGEEDGWPFWIVRNSFGSDWGEDGYIRIWSGQDLCSVESYFMDQVQIE